MDVYFLVNGDIQLLLPKMSKNKEISNSIIGFEIYLVMMV